MNSQERKEWKLKNLETNPEKNNKSEDVYTDKANLNLDISKMSPNERKNWKLKNLD